MKKLLTICLIMATIFTVNAQDEKPTKEETVAFINRTTNECKGYELPFAMGILQNADFSEKKLIYKTSLELNPGEKYCDHKEVYEDINWENLIVEDMEFNEKLHLASFYYITFKTNLSITVIDENCNRYGENSEETSLQLNMYVFIPKNKKESIKKAFLRLSEIAKEENKDPFQD